MTELLERFKDEIAGVVACCDRRILQGRMPIWSYAAGRTRDLTQRGVTICDCVAWAQPLPEAIQEHAEKWAAEAGRKIDYVGQKNFRHERKIAAIGKTRGTHPGLVWIFSLAIAKL